MCFIDLSNVCVAVFMYNACKSQYLKKINLLQGVGLIDHLFQKYSIQIKIPKFGRLHSSPA